MLGKDPEYPKYTWKCETLRMEIQEGQTTPAMGSH